MCLIVPFVDGLSLACTAMIQIPTGQEETDTSIIRPHDKRSLRLICSERETTFPNRETQHTHRFVLEQDPISTIDHSEKRKLRVVSGLDKVSINQGRHQGDPEVWRAAQTVLYSTHSFVQQDMSKTKKTALKNKGISADRQT